MLAAILALFVSNSQAQEISSSPSRNILTETRIDGMDISIKELQSGRPVLTSSPTFRGVPTFSNGITFGDATTQTTAAVSYSIANSSSTRIPTTTSSQGSCLVCIATVAVTMTGKCAEPHVTGVLNQSGYSSANVHTWFGVLQDGAHVFPSAAAEYGIGGGWADGGQNQHDVSIVAILQSAASAGAHNYCLCMANDSGRTLVFNAGGQFGVKEVNCGL